MCKLLVAMLWILFIKASFAGNREINEADALTETRVKELLQMESILIDNLEKYAEALERKLNIISNAVKEMEAENNYALKDAEKYLGNPLKSFSLIRRLHADWKAWQKYFLKPVGQEFIQKMKNILKYKPTKKELTDAIGSLHRLQSKDTLQAAEIAEGLLQYDANLTMRDAFSIGKALYKLGFPVHSMAWLQAAMHLDYDKTFYKRVYSLNINKVFEIYKKVALNSSLPYIQLETIQSGIRKKSIMLVPTKKETQLSKYKIKEAFEIYTNICPGFDTRHSPWWVKNMFLNKSNLASV